MDKTALNYANLFDYQKALKLKGNQFNYLSASEYLLPVLGMFCADIGVSGVCWVLLRSISLWLAHWKIPRAESASCELSLVGCHGSCFDAVSVVFECS